MSRRTIVSARSVSILRGISSPPWRTAKKSRTRARKKSSSPRISGNGKLITSFLRGGALAENTKIHSIRGTRSGLWWVTKASFQSSWTPWAEDNGDGSFSLFFSFSGNLAPERLSSWERLDPKEEEEEERRTERGKKTPVLVLKTARGGLETRAKRKGRGLGVLCRPWDKPWWGYEPPRPTLSTRFPHPVFLPFYSIIRREMYTSCRTAAKCVLDCIRI